MACKSIISLKGGFLIVIGILATWFYLYNSVSMKSQDENSSNPSILHSSLSTFSRAQEAEVTGVNDFGGFYFKQCNCYKHKHFRRKHFKTKVASTCSEEADWYGDGQKILSYTFFNDTAPKPRPTRPDVNGSSALSHFDGIQLNVEQVKKLYPGWIMRLYSNCELDSRYCHYACMDEFMWCDVRQSRFRNLESVNPRIWRFMALGDPTVDLFVSRDLDSLITEREREAVAEWEHSPFTFHLTRDGLEFKRHMLAGAWGSKNFEFALDLRQEMMAEGLDNTERNLDEDLLQDLVFYRYNDSILSHDSYSCKEHLQVPSVPFPKQRKNLFTRVALPIGWTKTFRAPPCPIECRPPYGKNWTYC